MLEILAQFYCLLFHFSFLKFFLFFFFSVSQLPFWTAHTSPEWAIPGAVVAKPNTAESSHQLGSFLDTVWVLSPLDSCLLRCSQVSWSCNRSCYYHLQKLSPISWAVIQVVIFFCEVYPTSSTCWCQIPSSLRSVSSNFSIVSKVQWLLTFE